MKDLLQSISVHSCVIGLTGYMFFICLKYQTLFSLHPFCMTAAYVLLLTEAAFAFYGKYSLIPRNAAFHGWVMLLANLFSLVGFISVYLNKISMSKSHFTSYHGQIGLAVIFHMIFQLFMGIMLQFYSKFKALIFVPYRMLRTFHLLSALLLISTSLLTVLLGFQSFWFAITVGNVRRFLFSCSLLALAFLTLPKLYARSVVRLTA